MWAGFQVLAQRLVGRGQGFVEELAQAFLMGQVVGMAVFHDCDRAGGLPAVSGRPTMAGKPRRLNGVVPL